MPDARGGVVFDDEHAFVEFVADLFGYDTQASSVSRFD